MAAVKHHLRLDDKETEGYQICHVYPEAGVEESPGEGQGNVCRHVEHTQQVNCELFHKILQVPEIER